jgi:hypothetical protein
MQAHKLDIGWEHNRPRRPLSDEERRFLNTLRLVGRACRAKARQDLFQACAVLSCDRTVAHTAYAETLMRCLSQALGKQPILYLPGEAEVSFDEAWLLQLASAIAAEDTHSTEFLLRSRVHPHARRHCGFLMKSIVEQFSLI